MEKQTYEHKGVPITYEPALDRYVSVIKGESLSGSSLAVVKALIDATKEKK